jgi:low temperature requirement protein LtrA
MSTDDLEDRRNSTTVGWFELFYDLVVVAPSPSAMTTS